MSQQINLFNPALLKQKQVFTSRTILTALAVLLVGGVALSLYTRQTVQALASEEALLAQQLNAAKLRQAKAMTEFAPRTKSAALQQQIEGATTRLDALRNVEDILTGGGTGGYAEHFRALARQSSGELWLTGLSIRGTGNAIGLQGRALSADAVPAYISRLTREPVLQGKTFGGLQISRPQIRPEGAKSGDAPQDAPFIEFALQAEGSAAGGATGVAP